MSVTISNTSGDTAFDLIFPDYLASMPALHVDTMHRSIMNSSRVWVGFEDDKILCVWGIIAPTLLSDRAYLWMFATPNLQNHTFILIRHSQRIVDQILQEYDLIVGHVALGNDKAIRWIKWLGATFGEPQGKLIPFEIRANHGSV